MAAFAVIMMYFERDIFLNLPRQGAKRASVWPRPACLKCGSLI